MVTKQKRVQVKRRAKRREKERNHRANHVTHNEKSEILVSIYLARAAIRGKNETISVITDLRTQVACNTHEYNIGRWRFDTRHNVIPLCQVDTRHSVIPMCQRFVLRSRV